MKSVLIVLGGFQWPTINTDHLNTVSRKCCKTGHLNNTCLSSNSLATVRQALILKMPSGLLFWFSDPWASESVGG